MLIRIWGARGSISLAPRQNSVYGGDTSCVEVRGAGEDLIVLDGGSGLFSLGQDILTRSSAPRRLHILLSHLHWDHILGLPFFAPAFNRDFEVHVYFPRDIFSSGRELLQEQVARSGVDGDYRASYHELEEDCSFDIGICHVRTALMNHPALDLGYRLECEGKILCYCTDGEPAGGALLPRGLKAQKVRSENISWDEAIFHKRNLELARFVRGADLCIHDTMFDGREYEKKRGWGHSPYEFVLELAYIAEVKRLLMFHLAPNAADDDLDEFCRRAREFASEFGDELRVDIAKQGLEISL